jgi:hypothetical protein
MHGSIICGFERLTKDVWKQDEGEASAETLEEMVEASSLTLADKPPGVIVTDLITAMYDELTQFWVDTSSLHSIFKLRILYQAICPT